jgi:hypothetical protein
MSTGGNIGDLADARREVAGLKQQLDALYTDYLAALGVVPINFQGELHKYMCVRLSGYLEQLFFVAVVGYVKSTANGQTASFALSRWKNAPNLSPGALEQLIERFGKDRLDDLALFLDDANRRGNLGTLLKIRNDTAHGGSYGGSLPSVTSYKSLVDDIHAWVNRTFLS